MIAKVSTSRKSTRKIICRGQAHFTRISASYSFGKKINNRAATNIPSSIPQYFSVSSAILFTIFLLFEYQSAIYSNTEYFKMSELKEIVKL